MRTYYLFKINESFSILYLNKTFYLYKMLEQISLSSKTDFIISYRLFEQMVISTHYFNRFISLKEWILKRKNMGQRDVE